MDQASLEQLKASVLGDVDMAPPAKTRVIANGAGMAPGSASGKKESMQSEINTKKLLANNSQQIRMIAGVLLWTWAAPMALCKSALEAGTKYNTTNKGMKANGPPWAYTVKAFFMTVLEALFTVVGSLAEGEELKFLQEAGALIQSYLKDMQEAGPKKAAKFVRYFQVKTVKDPNSAIVVFQISSLYSRHLEVERALHLVMEALKAELKDGAAPASPMEGALQTEIDNLKKSLAAEMTQKVTR
jgi:hypothetical protein